MNRCLKVLIRGVIGSIALVSSVFATPLATSPLVSDGDQAKAPAARPKHTPLERMALERLKATHEDLERVRKTRRVLPVLPGMNDYRAIFHAHAEDSSHTGGTRLEMLSEAKKAGVQAIFLTDHHRPPKVFIRDSWRGLREGVLFVPGSEANGFLLYPANSIMEHMNSPAPPLIEATRALAAG